MKRLLVAALSLCLLTVFKASAQELDVQTPSSEIEVQAGETVTVPLVISGPSGTYNARTDLPEGWDLITFTGSFDVRERRTELVTLRVPQTALKGSYEFTYRVRSVADVEEETVKVNVPERREVVARLETMESAVISGDGFTSTLVLENRSNVPVSLDLSKRSSEFETEGLPSNVALEAGEVRRVSLDTQTDSRMTRSVDSYLRVTATDVETGDQIMARASRPVVPVARQTGLDYHTYPLEFGFQTVHQQRFGERTWLNQYWLSGDGTLREGSPTNFEFMAKTPAIEGTDFREDAYSIFPMYSEYYLTVDNPLYRIDLGDRYFDATELTGNTASGFGGGAEFTGKAEVGAFYTTTRRYSVDRDQFGARAGYNFSDRLYTGVNVGWVDGYYAGESGSFLIDTQPTDLIEFTGEASVDRSGGQVGQSYFTEARIGNSDYNVSGGFESYSDVNPSWDRGSLRYRTRGSATALWGTRFNAGYYHVENDLVSDYTDDTFRFSINRSRVGVFYRHGVSSYNSSFSSRNTVENAVGGNLRIGPRYLYLTTRTELTRYTYRHLPGDPQARQEEYRGTLTARAGGVQASVGADYRSGAREFSPENRENLGLNASLDYSWASSAIGASSNAYNYNSWSYNHRAYAQHEFASGSTLRLEGIYRDFFRDEWGVRLQGTVPVNVPIHKSQKTGLAFGKVTDENGQPVQGLPVYVNGYASITNADGMFYVGSIEPGQYEVSVDRAALAVNDIVLGTSEPVTIYPAQRTQSDVQVIEGAGVEGKVTFESGEPAMNQVVEISNGEDSYRRVTSSRGTVSFTGLMPGEWNVRMVDEINDYNSRGQLSSFELEAGDVGTFSFTAHEKQQVQFVNEEPEEVKPELKWYTVKEGDWLSKLAEREYQDMFKWPVIYDANMERIEDPNLIYPGQRIIIPILK